MQINAEERRSYLFTLRQNRKHAEHRIAVLRRQIRDDNIELERLVVQLNDIDQSIDYLEE